MGGADDAVRACPGRSAAAARRLVGKYGPARVVTACRVFAHIDDMHKVTEANRSLLRPYGLFVFEIHNLPDFLETSQVDMMYREHLMHYSLEPLPRLFAQHGMEIFDVVRIPIPFCSIRVSAQREESPRPEPVNPAVGEPLDFEFRLGPDSPATFDASLERQGRVVPGTLNPIVSSEVFRADSADVALLCACNDKAEVAAAEAEFLGRGERKLLRLPDPVLEAP